MKASKLCLIGLLAFFSSCAFSEGATGKNGYLTDSQGNVVRGAFGTCWHSGFWTPDMAIAECEPYLIKKAEAATPVVQEKSAAIPLAVPAIHFNAETLFDFDRAVVKPEGQKILDEKIVPDMKSHPDAAPLIITGHTDRIGTVQYNQDLSERRANAVQAYLEKQGIDARRMSALGKGKSEPDPVANTKVACRGMRGEKLIACLQPDRRVTVKSTAGSSSGE